MSDEGLVKSADDKWITGVAGGLAAKFGLPSILVRLCFVFTFGFGLLCYIILFFVMKNPE